MGIKPMTLVGLCLFDIAGFCFFEKRGFVPFNSVLILKSIRFHVHTMCRVWLLEVYDLKIVDPAGKYGY